MWFISDIINTLAALWHSAHYLAWSSPLNGAWMLQVSGRVGSPARLVRQSAQQLIYHFMTDTNQWTTTLCAKPLE